MYSESEKAQAIALLRHNHSPMAVAEQLDMPVKLVVEWQSKMTSNDLTAIHSNTHAIEVVLREPTPPNILQTLKEKCEKTALEIVCEVSNNVGVNDVMHSKSLQLAADTISRLYGIIVTKLVNPTDPGNGDTSLFQSLKKD